MAGRLTCGSRRTGTYTQLRCRSKPHRELGQLSSPKRVHLQRAARRPRGRPGAGLGDDLRPLQRRGRPTNLEVTAATLTTLSMLPATPPWPRAPSSGWVAGKCTDGRQRAELTNSRATPRRIRPRVIISNAAGSRGPGDGRGQGRRHFTAAFQGRRRDGAAHRLRGHLVSIAVTPHDPVDGRGRDAAVRRHRHLHGRVRPVIAGRVQPWGVVQRRRWQSSSETPAESRGLAGPPCEGGDDHHLGLRGRRNWVHDV